MQHRGDELVGRWREEEESHKNRRSNDFRQHREIRSSHNENQTKLEIEHHK
jgi:hypothetical protein